MGVKQYKPTSPGRRFQTVSDFADITSTTPEKSLLRPLPKKAGRNNNGRITTRIVLRASHCFTMQTAKSARSFIRAA